MISGHLLACSAVGRIIILESQEVRKACWRPLKASLAEEMRQKKTADFDEARSSVGQGRQTRKVSWDLSLKKSSQFPQ